MLTFLLATLLNSIIVYSFFLIWEILIHFCMELHSVNYSNWEITSLKKLKTPENSSEMHILYKLKDIGA